MAVKPKQSRKWLWLLFLLLPALTYLFLQLFIRNPRLAESYARNVFPIVTYIPRTLTRLIPFSLTEVVVVVGPIVLIILIIATLVRLFSSKPNNGVLGRWLKALFLSFCILYPVFMLNFGYTYHRQPLAKNLGLNQTKRAKEELFEAGLIARSEVNRLASEVRRDSEGLFDPELSTREILNLADSAYKARMLDRELSRYTFDVEVGVKPVRLSRFWSYTGITGMYVPFFVESNVNIDVRPDEMMFTALHEVAHSYGIAREDEANFLAFYSGILHENKEMQYSAWLMGYTYLNNALYGASKDLHSELYSGLAPEASADLAARSRYWKQFEGPVKEVSTSVNDSYLKANKQEDGVKSYGRIVDLILAYFEKEGTA